MFNVNDKNDSYSFVFAHLLATELESYRKERADARTVDVVKTDQFKEYIQYIHRIYKS